MLWKLSASRNSKFVETVSSFDVQAKESVHLAVSLGAFILLDRWLKNLFLENAIRFPSALFGMLSFFVLLSGMSAINEGIATSHLLHGALCTFSQGVETFGLQCCVLSDPLLFHDAFLS